MRKKLIRSLLVLGFSVYTLSVCAQPAIPRKYVEHPGFSVGLNFGLADLWGDVGTQGILDHYANEIYWTKPNFMGGIFFRYTAHPSLGLRLNLNYGTLFATDEWNITKAKTVKSIEDDPYQRYLRNQDSRANTWESTFLLEFIPLRWNSESRMAAKKMQPYLMAGVGVFYYRPQTTVIDPVTHRKVQWVDTRWLFLEGNVTSPIQIAIPVGIGLRWDLSDNMSFGFEYLYRFTTTDYLDNVSSSYVTPDFYDRTLSPQDAAMAKKVYDKSWAIEPSYKNKAWSPRGNKDNNDGYSTISIQLLYRLETNKIPWWH